MDYVSLKHLNYFSLDLSEHPQLALWLTVIVTAVDKLFDQAVLPPRSASVTYPGMISVIVSSQKCFQQCGMTSNAFECIYKLPLNVHKILPDSLI